MKKISKFWKEHGHKFYINDHSNTWLHYTGFLLHSVSKLFISPFTFKKYKIKHEDVDKRLLSKLDNKFKIYKAFIKHHQDENGFILSEHCDSLLYTGLLSDVLSDVKIRSAQDMEGYWHRRSKPCYPKHSKSTISRDMLLGLYWYIWQSGSKEMADELLVHAKRNSYVMGLGDPARLLMMPSGEATLAEICYRKGGKNRWFTRHQLQAYPKNLKGYEVHLLVQHILLRGEVVGYIDSSAYSALEHYAYKHPHNALYQAAYALYAGGINDVMRILLSDHLWPYNKLPTTKNYSSDWVISRDMGADWMPADGKEKQHTGGDFLCAANLY